MTGGSRAERMQAIDDGGEDEQVTTASSTAAQQAQEIAEMLTAIAGTEVVLIDGGYRVKETGEHWVDVLRMFFSWRIVTTPKDCPEGYDRHWCYAGTSLLALIGTVGAAVDWDGANGTEPAGWNKNGQTEEWREPHA
jgi:hypothetical protein